MTWMETLAENGHKCGLGGCLGHCPNCGCRYTGSLCFGPPCNGCSHQVDAEEAFVPTLRSTDILCEHYNNRVLLLVKSLVGQSRPIDETAWHLALRAEKIAELRSREPALGFLIRGEELKHELIVITVVLEQVYGLPPPPPRWGINP